MQDTKHTEQTKYPYKLQLGNLSINYRKWKVKDRKNFLKILEDVENISEEEASNVLVYNCIDRDYVFSADEFRYVLTAIRSKSVSETFTFDYICEECSAENSIELELDDVIKFKPANYSNIEVDNITIKLGEIINKELYQKTLKEATNSDEAFFIDFIYHIMSINNQELGFNEVQDFLEELDVDVMDKILDKWVDKKAYLSDIKELECNHCQYKQVYSFDEIPDFFPSVWFKR